MCPQIAKYQLLCYNFILFIAAHLGHLLSDFFTSDWCTVTLSSVWPQRWRRTVWLTWRLFPSVLWTLSLLFSLQFPGGACLWAAEWEALFDFFMHVMLRYEFTVLGYNDLLLHLCVSSTLVNHGDKVFHYPPTASNSIAVFSSRTKGWAQDAVGSLLRGLSICMDALIRRWEWVFSLEKKLGQRKACM